MESYRGGYDAPFSLEAVPSLREVLSVSPVELGQYLSDKRRDAIRKFRENNSVENYERALDADRRSFMFQAMCDALPPAVPTKSRRRGMYPKPNSYDLGEMALRTAMYQLYGEEINAMRSKEP